MGCTSSDNNVNVLETGTDIRRTKTTGPKMENNKTNNKSFKASYNEDSSEIEIKKGEKSMTKFEAYTKKIVYQKIFSDSNDYIYNKIQEYELKILQNIFFRNYYTKYISKIYSDQNYLKLNLNKSELNKIICNPESRDILKKLIFEHVEKIKQNDEDYKIKNLSILVIGRKGVGKTTLIKYILNNNNENYYENDKETFLIFTHKKCPYLRLIEFKGIGFGKNNPETIKKEAIEYIKRQEAGNNYNNIIHCIWYCITDTRFEESEIILLKKLKEVYNDNNIPIIVIYTKSIDVIMANKMLEYVKKLNIGVSTIKVMAKDDEDNNDQVIHSFGRDKLLNLTLKKCTEALKGKMIYIMTNAISNDIREKIHNKNNYNKKEIFKKISDDFIDNYEQILDENKFIEYIMNILKIDIFYLFDIYKNINKIGKLKYTLNLLKNSNLFSYIIKNYNDYYKKTIEESTITISSQYAKDFLDNQTKEEIKNGNVKIKNKRALKDIEKSNEIFFKKNFYFLFQKVIIKNFILDNNNIYYNNLQNKIEEIINELFVQDNDIKEYLSYCFLMKLKQFSNEINIDLEIEPFKFRELPYKEGSFDSYKEENTFNIQEQNPMIFTIKEDKEDKFNNLLKEKKRYLNYKQFFLHDNLVRNVESLNSFMEQVIYQFKDEYFSEKVNDTVYVLLMKKIKENLINYLSLNIENLIINIKGKFQSNQKYITKRKKHFIKKTKKIFDSAPPAYLINENKNENLVDFSPIENQLKRMILREKKDIFIDSIKNQIETLKSNDSYSINYLTVIVVGRSGVGKSTLINAIFREQLAETGAPEIQTTATKIYEPKGKNLFLQMIDTRGIELNNKHGPEKIIKNTINYINNQRNNEGKNINNFNDLIQGIWYCITGSNIEEKEIEIIIKLRKEFREIIPLIIVYTRMISKSNFNKMKERINQKINNAILIPILAEEVINDEENPNNVIKSFGLDELKNKTFELAKKLNGNIFNHLKNKASEYITQNIYEENNIFEEKTKNLLIESFIKNFKETKTENEFFNYIVELLGINFRKNDELEDNMSNKSVNELKEMEIIFSDIKTVLHNSKIYTKENIDSILEMKSMIYLDGQAIIEKVKQKSISNQLKKDKEEFKNIINNFLTDNFYYISQKFIIYYLILLKIIPFSHKIKELSNNIIVNLIENESESLYENLYIKKFEDFEEKIRNTTKENYFKSMK